MPRQPDTLEKKLGAFGVYALATGATLSAGFFLLPGLAAVQAGPALVLAYLLAAVPLVPAMLCKVELMTAMPRAGGIYYYLDRSLGPVAGTVGGLGIWLVLILKVSFALVGMGAYLGLFLPNLPVVPVAVGLAVTAGLVNVLGAKISGGVQVTLVVLLLSVLGVFLALGAPRIDPARFGGFLDAGWSSVFSTAGLVYVSYAGLTKVAGVAEEVTDPERNLPLGVFLALATALVVYGLGTAVIVGVVPMGELRGDLTSVATAGRRLFGRAGLISMSVAAMLAFIAVTNAGTLSASRYPLAMSRDRVVPEALERIGRWGTPTWSIAVTVGVMVLVLVVLDPMRIAKLASAFQLLVFSLICLSVVVMRESRIDEYDPGYRVPAYPWLPLFGVVAPLFFIYKLGWMPILFSGGLVGASLLWYVRYARDRVAREGAIYHIFERLGRRRHSGLERELRQILKEKGLREADPFGELVGRALVVDTEGGRRFSDVVRRASRELAERLPAGETELASTFMEETELGVTPVAHGAALPHVRLDGISRPHLVLVRSRAGLPLTDEPPPDEPPPDDGAAATDGGAIEPDAARDPAEAPGEQVHAVFFLVSPADDSRQHLRMLARLAERVEEDGFLDRWLAARGEGELKQLLLQDEQSVTLWLDPDRAAGDLAGRRLCDVELPDGVLVVLLRRHGQVREAAADEILEAGDRLTLLGDPEAIAAVRSRHDG